MPDSYMLCYIRLRIGPWLALQLASVLQMNFLPFYSKGCELAKASTHACTHFWIHRPLRDEISKKLASAYEGGVAAQPSTGSFGELNSMQKPDFTKTPSCIIEPYLNAQKTELMNFINTNN